MTQGRDHHHGEGGHNEGGNDSAVLQSILSTQQASLETLQDIAKELKFQRANSAAILTALAAIIDKENKQMKSAQDFAADFKEQLDKQTADLAKQTTVVGAIKTLVEQDAAKIAGLTKQLQDAIDGQSNPDVTAVFQPLVDQAKAIEEGMRANTDALATAAVQGTSAEGEAGPTGRSSR